MRNTVDLGVVNIHGPTASDKNCSIFEDLASIFGCELSSEAVVILQNEWKKSGNKRALDVDRESDRVSIVASKARIVDVATLINQVAGSELDKESISHARKQVKGWKQPEAVPWRAGDVFYIKLSESLVAYGQVLAKAECNTPTCLLFSHSTELAAASISSILSSKPVSILHVSDEYLDNGDWVIMGNEQPVLSPESGACGVYGEIGSSSWNGLHIMAKAWHGLEPWNNYYKDNFLDEMLIAGVSRPNKAIMASREVLEGNGIVRPEW